MREKSYNIKTMRSNGRDEFTSKKNFKNIVKIVRFVNL